MALTHLVDTSVLTRLGSDAVLGVVRPLAAAGKLGRAGISDLEIGFSARNADEWDRLTGALDAFELVETTSSHVQRAKQVQRALAANSQRGRKVPDLLVAAAAEETGLGILHYDADFDLITAVTGQPATWVVPAGTID
jgi:predicted nucleic acid-binding protein